MGSSSLASFIGRLRRLVEPRGGGLDDAELLERFVRQRDEAAFEVLLWRYGPLVLGVCRRMLRREQDVEDAFQATFLTLVRKAGSITRRQALAGWLHQVAYRIGLRARAGVARSGIQDQEVIENVAYPMGSVDDGLRELLDQEVQRLPRRYRMPLILCYLDGKTNEEAARLLACPPGTIASRLAWARQRLRTRLTARGLEVPVTITALTLAAEMRAGPLPALIATALRTARLVATGTLAGSASVPVHVIVWSKGVLRAMSLSKIQWVATFFFASVLIGSGGGIIWQRVQAGDIGPDRTQEPRVQTTVTPEPNTKTSAPPTDTKSAAKDASTERARLQLELDNAMAEFLRLDDRWRATLKEAHDLFWKSQREQRREKLRLSLELKKLNKALDLAESRFEKQKEAVENVESWAKTQLETFARRTTGKELERIDERLKKEANERRQKEMQKLRQAQVEVERINSKILDCEMAVLDQDELLDRGKLELQWRRSLRDEMVDGAYHRVKVIEQKLFVNNALDTRLQGLERKIDTLTRAVDDLLKVQHR